jgi:hypothetical protein
MSITRNFQPPLKIWPKVEFLQHKIFQKHHNRQLYNIISPQTEFSLCMHITQVLMHLYHKREEFYVDCFFQEYADEWDKKILIWHNTETLIDRYLT